MGAKVYTTIDVSWDTLQATEEYLASLKTMTAAELSAELDDLRRGDGWRTRNAMTHRLADACLDELQQRRTMHGN